MIEGIDHKKLMKVNTSLLAVQLLGQWNRLSQVHLSLSSGCSCAGSMPGIAVTDLEINIIDFLCEKYKKEVAFDQWLKQFAQYREGHMGSLSDLLKNIAIQPPSKSLATRVLNDLSNTITSLNKSHLG